MAAPVRVGEVLAEKYEVTKILGQGGMGVVVAARHRDLDKLVALKFMHEEVAVDGTAIDRFLREARAAARLRNEHVGHVLDVGRTQNGVPYIVMEYLEGRDLSDVAADAGGALPPADVCEYMLQTCEAMAEAHAQGIIHRDLKPQNLFLTTRADGRPLIKVLDFGISKIQASAGPTGTQQVMGTPAYMAPEQMRSSKNADSRADIWSLGVILYQLLGGHLPFGGENFAETMLKVISDVPPPLASLRPELPPGLVRAVERCLEKNREKRFSNVAELAHELMPFAPDRARAAMSLIERVMSAGVAQPPRERVDDDLVPSPAAVRSKPVAAPTTLGSAASAMSFETKSAKPSPTRWIAVSVFAVGATAAITVFAMRGGGNGDTTPAFAPEADRVAPAAQPATEVAPPESDPTGSPLVDAGVDVVTRDATPDAGIAVVPPRDPGNGAKPTKPSGGTKPTGGTATPNTKPNGGTATPTPGSATPDPGSATRPGSAAPSGTRCPVGENCSGRTPVGE